MKGIKGRRSYCLHFELPSGNHLSMVTHWSPVYCHGYSLVIRRSDVSSCPRGSADMHTPESLNPTATGLVRWDVGGRSPIGSDRSGTEMAAERRLGEGLRSGVRHDTLLDRLKRHCIVTVLIYPILPPSQCNLVRL